MRRLMLELYREVYRGWNVKHFHEHLVRDHGFRWGYTWVKTQLAHGGPGGARQAAWGAPSQARAQAVGGHDAAPGRLAGRVACRAAAARSDCHDGRRDEHDLLGVPDRGRRHGFDVSGACWRCSPPTACRRASTPIAAATTSIRRRRRAGRQGPADPGRPGAGASGSRAHPGLFAGGARAQRADVRHPAGPADQGAGEGRHRRDRRRQRLDPGRLPAGA